MREQSFNEGSEASVESGCGEVGTA